MELNIDSKYKESLCVKTLSSKEQTTLLWGVCTGAHPAHWRTITICMSFFLKMSNMKPAHLMIAGDFNFPETDWDTITTSKKDDTHN